jgi:hypothetical protein
LFEGGGIDSNSEVDAVILTSSFFPPVQYFTHLFAAGHVLIETCENYQKKTYRNRYLIYSANGIIPLSVPIEKADTAKQLIKNIRVSYNTPWNENHWKTIESAYKSSPYFLYYEDEIRAVFMKKWDFLFDMNIASINAVENCLEIKTDIALTTTYHPFGYYKTDLRELIQPKININKDINFIPIEYRQVFGLKHGFIPNLSILDLLFNKGPETLLILQEGYNRREVMLS